MVSSRLYSNISHRYLQQYSSGLIWLSAILDNATLAAAEIGPALTELQIKSVLVGLLIAGGMLIPGNIPNIISASKLGITSKEWARLGVPLGLVSMGIYFIILFVIEPIL